MPKRAAASSPLMGGWQPSALKTTASCDTTPARRRVPNKKAAVLWRAAARFEIIGTAAGSHNGCAERLCQFGADWQRKSRPMLRQRAAEFPVGRCPGSRSGATAVVQPTPAMGLVPAPNKSRRPVPGRRLSSLLHYMDGRRVITCRPGAPYASCNGFVTPSAPASRRRGSAAGPPTVTAAAPPVPPRCGRETAARRQDCIEHKTARPVPTREQYRGRGCLPLGNGSMP